MVVNMTLARLATQVVATLGVSKVIGDVIAKNVAPPQTTIALARNWVGSLVIGSMVIDQASKHVDEKYNQAVAWYEDRQKEAASK